MPRDLRDWLAGVEALGELRRIEGADWNLEMGTLVELLAREADETAPAVLFDRVPGYAAGYRCLFGATGSVRRLAHTLGIDSPRTGLELVKAYRDRLGTLRPIEPVAVADGPIRENILRGEECDILRFPVPFMHERDGGRYIGTACLVVTRDPEQGWINLGTYRGMVHDARHTGLYISPGKHGRLHLEKYLQRDEPCPVMVVVGQDPLLFTMSGNEAEWGVSEYALAGGVLGEPIEVIGGEVTGLPMPARAEIVLEGFVDPRERRTEGPFGEWTGYYASGERPEPVVRIERIYHRHDPILTCARPGRPPSDYSFAKGVIKSAMIWDELEKAGLPQVRGVWCHEAGGGRLFNIVAIEQAYPGHARQAGMLAAQVHAGAYLGRFVVVVDHDIDPSNTFDVIWAMSSRVDPVEDIDFIRRAWSGPLDPRIPPGQKGHNSRAVIDATRPYEWRDRFPPVAEASERAAQVGARVLRAERARSGAGRALSAER